MTSKENYLDYPVFICGHRKAGTTLLINLFDGATDAVTFPDDSGFFYLFYPRFDTTDVSLSEKIIRLSDFMIKEHFFDVLRRPNCDPQERLELEKKCDVFYKNMKEYSKNDDSLKALLGQYISSFQKAYYPESGDSAKVWIEKTTSTEIYASELKKTFPNAKFIHLVRDPRDNWAALQSGWDKRYKNYNDNIQRLKQSLLERGLLGMKMASYNLAEIGGDDYRIVRFEDLTVDSKGCMRSLADFIGVEFNDNLITPTILGYPWQGNSFDKLTFKNVSSANVNRWQERISNEDAQLIEFYFEDVMKEFHYEPLFSKREQQQAAINHYKWFNFSTQYSAK